ncbi:MAG: major capsid protein [Deltaproteobacteria bacterium]|nr:major capsid protein [Deltaproteobacteria bacterium]
MAAIDEFTEYSPVELQSVVQTTKQNDLFFRKMVVNGEVYSDSTVVEFDTEEDSNHAAVYVSRLGGPNEVGEQGYETTRHCLPYLYEQKSWSPEDFLDRLPGEVVGAGVSVASRMVTKMTKGIANLNKRFDMAEELQVKEALETGKVTVSGKGVEYLVDFQRDAALTVTNAGGSKWSDSVDKFAQIAALAAQGETHGYSFNEVYMDQLAGAAFLGDEDIIKLLDTKNYDVGSVVNEDMREMKATFIGRIKHAGFDCKFYIYRGKYTDNSDTIQPVMTANMLIMRDTSAAAWKMHYGMIANFKAPSFKGKRFSMNGITEDGKLARTTLESGPLIEMKEPNSVGVLKTEG